MLENTEGPIKNGQPRETFNFHSQFILCWSDFKVSSA